MSCIAILTGGLLAELQVALAAAGIVMSIADAKNAVGGIVQANKQKEASTTMHEAKKAAKVMAESIAKLTLDVINVICTVAGYFKGKKKIVNKESNQALLKKSSVSEEDLIKYLESIDNYNAKNKGTVTNYALEYKNKGKWPDEVWVPVNESALNATGDFNWSLAKKGGYKLNSKGEAIKESFIPKIGEKFDRYGPENGRYVSPIIDGKPFAYNQRSLPYVEDIRQYHQYEVIGDFSKIDVYINNAKAPIKSEVYKYLDKYDLDIDDLVNYKGEIAVIKEWNSATDCGIQYELCLPIDLLKKLKLIK